MDSLSIPPTKPPSAPIPTLPSAKPPRPLIQAISILCLLMGVTGIGLGVNAGSIYTYRSQQKLDKRNQIAALESQAEINQRSAQLQRNQSAPVWINTHAYEPSATYTLEGTSAQEVPVLVGIHRDTAVCVGVLGPDGFTQNPDNPLCLGY